MNNLHLFAGTGGGIIADMILGHTPVGAVEIDPFCRKVLQMRQEEGWLPRFPIFEDVRSFRGDEIQKRVDCVSGGFPCQDISSAGRGAGIHGERSSLFFELARICRAIRPNYIFLENSPAIISRGLDTVLGEIAEMGYDAEWCVLSAADLGAWHRRERWWCLCKRERLPTPTARDCKAAGPCDLKRHSPKLSTVVRYPTPRTTGLANGKTGPEMIDRLYREGKLNEEERVAMRRGWPGGKLNPDWVEWLMGWPIGWTALKALETARSPLAPRQRS